VHVPVPVHAGICMCVCACLFVCKLSFTFPSLRLTPAVCVFCQPQELNFLDYVVSPLWGKLAEVMPQFNEQLTQLKSNRSVLFLLGVQVVTSTPAFA